MDMNLCGLLQGQRAQRIEMLLLHEFHRQKFMLPDKMKSKDRERLTKAAAQVKRENDGEMDIDEPEKPGLYFIPHCAVAVWSLKLNIFDSREIAVIF